MDKIIAISGKQFAGKDTLCQLLLKYLPDYRRVALADALKDEYAETAGIPREHVDILKARDPKVRGDLIALGKKRREEDEDYWVKKVLEQSGNKIVTDLRFPNEMNRFKEHNAILIRIETNRSVRAKRGKLCHETDLSEIGLDHVKDWHFVVSNNGSIEALEREARQIARLICTQKTEVIGMMKAFTVTIYLINTLLLLFIMKIILGMGVGLLAAWFQLTSAVPTSGIF